MSGTWIGILFFVCISMAALMFVMLMKLQSLKQQVQSGNGVLSTFPQFTQSLGKVEQMADDFQHLEKRINDRMKTYEDKVDPLKDGMQSLIGYFGGLKSGAGKVGELAFDLLLENYPQGKVLRHQQLENGKSVEFVIQVGNEWVPVDNKLTDDPRRYLKREIPKVGEQYLGKRMVAGKGDDSNLRSFVATENTVTAPYGLIAVNDEETYYSVIADSELRSLMAQHQVWVVSPNSFHWQLFFLDWVARESNKARHIKDFLAQIQTATSSMESALRYIGTMEKQFENAKTNTDKAREEIQKAISKLQDVDNVENLNKLEEVS